MKKIFPFIFLFSLTIYAEEEKDIYIENEVIEKTKTKEEGVKIDFLLTPQDIFVGEIFTLKITLKYPSKTRVYFPEHPEISPSVTILNRHRTAPIKKESEKFETHTFSLLPVRIGEFVLNEIEIPYIDEDGKAGRILIPEIKINIRRKLTDMSKLEIKKPEKTFSIMVKNTFLITGLLIAGSVAIAVFLTMATIKIIRARRQRLKPPPPPKPAHIIAFEKLDEIAKEALLSKKLVKLHYTKISEVIREYIENLLHFSALEMTTTEILQSLEKNGLKRVSITELRDFLENCDLVKFAKFIPDEKVQEEILPWAIDIVKRSMKVSGEEEQGQVN